MKDRKGRKKNEEFGKNQVKIIIDKANIYVRAVQLFTNCKAFTFSKKKKIL